MSLDHLINLAHRTGDRLIVHNELENKDVVLMNINEYEQLTVKRKKDVRALSEEQLVDQINRDLGIWRANRDLDEDWEKDLLLEDELTDFSSDSFGDRDYHSADWHSAGDIMEDRYQDLDWLNNEISDAEAWEDDDEDEDEFDFPEFFAEREDEIKVEDIPDFADMQTVPFKDSGEVDWQEEPLVEEEPIFYEEPVS